MTDITITTPRGVTQLRRMQTLYSLKVIRTCQTPPNHVHLQLVGLYHGKKSSGVSTSGRKTSRKGRKSVSIFGVSQIAVEIGIRTRLKLLAYANNQKKKEKQTLQSLSPIGVQKELMRP